MVRVPDEDLIPTTPDDEDTRDPEAPPVEDRIGITVTLDDDPDFDDAAGFEVSSGWVTTREPMRDPMVTEFDGVPF